MLNDSFLDFINKENLITKDDNLLLAISGGLDSTVLAHLLFTNGFQFSLAHMNFQLRGEDSDKDQHFVEDLAQHFQVKCYVKKVKISGSDIENQGSTQMQARKLRYDWFKKIMADLHFNKLLTAHHAEDSLETVLLNLTRGTGIKGLRGIQPKKGHLVRPLLFTDKESILAYAKQHDLKWREDLSNLSDNYKRNSLRHHVIPHLLQQNPNLFEVFNDTSSRLRATEYVYEEKIEEVKAKFCTQQKDGGLVIGKALLSLKYGVILLSEILKPYGFSLQQLKAFSFDGVGSRLESKKFILYADREELILKQSYEDTYYQRSIILSEDSGQLEGEIAGTYFNLKWKLIEPSEIDFDAGKNIAFFDFDKLKMPLVLRSWRTGDRINPLGMKGNMKVSDILINDKVSLPDKARQLLLEAQEETVWLIGRRVSGKFKITDETKKVLRLEYHET